MSGNSISPTVTNQTLVTAPATAKSESTNSESINSDSTAAAPSASYTVSISNAAKAALAEAKETAAQMTQEARNGDHQGQRLLAQEQATKPK